MGLRAQYRRYAARRLAVGLALALIFFLLAAYALTHGAYRTGLMDVLGAVTGSAGETVRLVVVNIRLLRIAAAALVGASLAVAGAVTQAVLRNPLATPFTIGVSHGAMFGAFLAILLGAGRLEGGGRLVILNSIYAVVLASFLGGVISVAVVLTLARIRGLSPVAIILAGVAMHSVFSALVILMQYMANDVQPLAMIGWTFGDLGRATWREDTLLLATLTPILAYFTLRSWDLNAMLAGDEVAKTVGVRVESLRLTLILLATLLTAMSVSFVGIIGFIDLVSPHLMRLMVGENYRFLIPLSALTGLVILLAADTVARLAFSSMILPVGVVTLFLGAPLFLYLLLKVESQKWRQ